VGRLILLIKNERPAKSHSGTSMEALSYNKSHDDIFTGALAYLVFKTALYDAWL
jgi:hypothetical protein